MAVVATNSVWLLLEFAAAPTDNNRLEIIKTAGTILVGTGGAVALLLAARRQRFVELDGTERRITDLQTKAADQLGADQAAVRLAGLYALERLAQDNPSHRQTIVDIICGYLRMPYSSPLQPPPPRRRNSILRTHQPTSTPRGAANDGVDQGKDPHQEKHVRITAQRILVSHLQPQPRDQRGRSANTKYWPNIDLDLSGSTLLKFDVRNCRIRSADFEGAVFVGVTSFDDTVFVKTCTFKDATLTDGALFERTQFKDGASFARAAFWKTASFESASFADTALFTEAKFIHISAFSKATFAGHTVFRNAVFNNYASFSDTIFTSPVDLTQVYARDDHSPILPEGWTLGSPADRPQGLRGRTTAGTWRTLARTSEVGHAQDAGQVRQEH